MELSLPEERPDALFIFVAGQMDRLPVGHGAWEPCGIRRGFPVRSPASRLRRSVSTRKGHMATPSSPRGSRAPRPGSRAIGGDGGKKRGGLLWLLLALLALIIVLVVVGLVSCGDDGDKSSGGAATTTATAASAPPAATAAPSAGASAGTLTAGGASLLDGQDFSNRVDQQATGTGIRVLATTKGGFVVGTPGTDPASARAVFVEYSSKVGADEAATSYKAEVGDTVDLTGPIKEAPSDPGRTLALEAGEAKLVRDEGAYVNADTVKEVGG